MLHETDIYTTLAKLGGADIPTDRAVDGIDQREFLLGKQEKSARECTPVFQGRELYVMKWRNYKMHFVWQVRMHDAPQKLAVPRLIDLYDNPQENIEETIGGVLGCYLGLGFACDVRGVGQAKGDTGEGPADPDGDARSLRAAERRHVKPRGIGIMRRNLFRLSDEQWKRTEPHLPTDVQGVERADDCRVISGIVHVLKSGCRWCDCPPEYGPQMTINNRFERWARRGIWENPFRELAGNGQSADTQMIDSTHVKAHRSAADGKGGSRSRLLAARAEGVTRTFTHSQMLKGASSLSC